MPFFLYQRDDCCLCDQAIDILASAGAPVFSSVWIDGDDELERRYGMRVPVLLDSEHARELDWPFDAASVRAFFTAR
ncbi:MAG: glutaredoxin family protein [Dokdonella sp.]